MTAAIGHAPVGPVGGPCETCGRGVALYAGRREHRRGSVSPGSAEWRAIRDRRGRAKAEALRNPKPGRCECGVRLDKHPPLPKPRPLRSSGWPGRGEGIVERGAR